jgi:ribosomal protein S18 acetylase RimI-like enzyme
MSVIVAPLNTEDVAAVKQLLVAGLSERWGSYEPTYNPDIEAFPSSYSNSLILVAKSELGVVGTGTLRPISARQAEVVRMSTCPRSRRNGVASKILTLLLEHARTTGVQEVVLETTSSWASAIAFYTKHGFAKTHEQNGDTHFVRHLQ